MNNYNLGDFNWQKRISNHKFQKFILSIILVFLLISPQEIAYTNAITAPETVKKQIFFNCGYQEQGKELMDRISQQNWINWIADLSGESFVEIDTYKSLITTRYSHAMFLGRENAQAYLYVLRTVQSWYPQSQIEEDEYRTGLSAQPWKNLILTLPGITSPEEIIILSAHLDSTSTDSFNLAPGADDNAGGVAALLEAARLLRNSKFGRTIKLIWFTGEEQGMLGSRAYVSDHDTTEIVGVINLDMFSYDRDNDRCFEMHIGTLAESDRVGKCFAETITAYDLDLKYDYFNNNLALNASDHSSFWLVGVGAIEIGENFLSQGTPNGCVGADENPYYHQVSDTLANMNPDYGFSIAQAAIISIYAMAMPSTTISQVLYLPLVW